MSRSFFNKMRKEVTFICLVFSIILFTSVLVSANVVNINLDKKYNVSLLSIDSSNVKFVVNNQNTKSLSEQDSPYQFYPYDDADKIENLDILVDNIIYQGYVGGEKTAEIILAYKVNISEGDSPLKINLNGEEYNVSLSFIDSSNAKFVINNQNTKSLSEQNSPYQFYPYDDADKIDNLDLIVSNIVYQGYVGGEHKAEVILAYKVNISEECIEDWSCTNWSSCTNNQQTRTCTDSNLCGTTENKPVESQSCFAPTPDIECYSDDDCWVDGTGQPYCEGDELCIPYMNQRCRNAGTEQSYCEPFEGVNCAPSDECKNSPEPQEECEQIGLRKIGKYCSSKYKLIDQKIEGTSCKNDFECKSNICQNGKCGENKPPTLIYWFIGIIVVVILFILIIYSVTKRQ